MSLLKNLTSDASISNETDRVGGGGVLNTGAYPMTVKLAYLTQAKSEAIALNLHLEAEDGRTLRQSLWMNSGKDKGGANFFIDKQGQKQYLPGFVQAQALALLTVGKEVSELDVEEKVVKLYDYEAKAEVPTKVQMVMDLLDKPILVGVIKQTVDKNIKDGNGNYVPSGETRDENEIDKFFRASDKKTTAEIRAQLEEADFINVWSAKHTAEFVKNKAKGAGATGTAGAPKAAAGAAAGTKKPTTSLFA